MAATDDRAWGPGGALAYDELRAQNQELLLERDELRRRLAEYEAQLFPTTEVARG